MKLQSNSIKECNLMPLLLRHKKQGYKNSECHIIAWPLESVNKVIEYLENNNIKFTVENNKLLINWVLAPKS